MLQEQKTQAPATSHCSTAIYHFLYSLQLLSSLFVGIVVVHQHRILLKQSDHLENPRIRPRLATPSHYIFPLCVDIIDQSVQLCWLIPFSDQLQTDLLNSQSHKACPYSLGESRPC